MNKETTTIKRSAEDNQYHRGKLVMNVDSPERQELVDRLVIHMIKTKKYRTRSDAIYSLLKERLDEMDEDEKKKPATVTAATVTAAINK